MTTEQRRKPAPKPNRAAKPKVARAPMRRRNVFDDIAALGRTIPAEEQARHTRDGAAYLEHYVYGVPKQDPD